MKANELRIGSIVQYRTSLGYATTTVQSINKEGTDLFVDDYTRGIRFDLGFEDLEPIPLTEQWLLDLGFEGRRYGFYNEHPISSCFLLAENGKYTFYIGEILMVDDQKSVRVIDHVHQLQNLYFAITGTELTFKTDTSRQ